VIQRVNDKYHIKVSRNSQIFRQWQYSLPRGKLMKVTSELSACLNKSLKQHIHTHIHTHTRARDWIIFTMETLRTTHTNFKIQGKGHPMTCVYRHRGQPNMQMLRIRNPALERGAWSASRSGCFTSGKDRVPIVQEAGWTAGPGWTAWTKSLAFTGIRPLEGPDRSESLHWLRYHGRQISMHVLGWNVRFATFTSSKFISTFR
jgi:hypothetical protein